jgi:hypothetical protein
MHPDLLASIDRFKQEMESVDEVAHVLLKGHLLVEEALSAVIDQYVFHREALEEARLTFVQKVHVARALCLRKQTLGEWELILAINALRNDMAHRLNSPLRHKKLARVKELYVREAANFAGLEEIKSGPESVLVLYACGHVAGFLATFLADSKIFRSLVHAMDRTMNPGEIPFEL